MYECGWMRAHTWGLWIRLIWRTNEASWRTIEACWRTNEAYWRTNEAYWRTNEAYWRTIEAYWLIHVYIRQCASFVRQYASFVRQYDSFVRLHLHVGTYSCVHECPHISDAYLHIKQLCQNNRCTATRCNTLQRTATHCNTLQHTDVAYWRIKPLCENQSMHCNTSLICGHSCTHE